DVRAHFRASLETSEYENASNLFHVTAADETAALLARCEILLATAGSGSGYGCADEQAASGQLNSLVDCVDSKVGADTGPNGYLQMVTSPSSSKNSLSTSREYIDLGSSSSLDCISTGQPVMGFAEKEPPQQLYEICQGQDQRQGQDEDESQQAITFTHELIIDCPYADLPAGHLALQRSTKYGQLQRIVPKRLFFDQTRKCYCGILNDWMLCYADGPTACRPSSSLYLKCSSIEIEHFGEGKRREICFQITTDDPNKKFVYQANNEVDAKEWIHAIEAAIRGDIGAHSPPTLKLPPPRKLPTPPVQKKAGYTSTDIIYEEPSPVYGLMDSSSHSAMVLPEKSNSPRALARHFEYDVPKCPAQRLEEAIATVASAAEVESLGQLNQEVEIKLQPVPSTLHGNLSLDFQARVKTVHSELSNQLSPGGPSPDRLKKAVKKSYSNGSGSEPEMLSPLTSPTHTPTKEQKKQRKDSKDCDKLAKNWFLSRLNKSAGLKTTNASNGSTANAKCKQSEKENLLTDPDFGEGFDGISPGERDTSLPSSQPTSPSLKAEAKSKVNMIINQFESSGHLSTMFSVEALAANALASLTSFCDGDGCNNYEPIMPLATPPSSFLKKV
ncbi:hypothetical protein KR009_007285, partial [Drosophila setifemur]